MFKALTRWAIVLCLVTTLYSPIAFGQEPKAITLDAAKKLAIVDEIATLLNKNYVFADTAKKMEEKIRGRLKNGDYDKLSGAADFAQAVSRDLTAVSKDKHLGFTYAPEAAANIRRLRSRNADEVKAAREKELAAARRDNFGFRKVERLAGMLPPTRPARRPSWR
ncbi:MAG: hypothetical protein NT147_01460 [Candidatus Aminicenantes bacterium]|nr:hypothetical protein [Candidatus Aminicenantes bacterium]